MLIWNLSVAVFLLEVGSYVVSHATGSLPSWTPGLGGGQTPSLITTIALTILLLPFVFAGGFITWLMLFSFFGHYEARLANESLEVRTGIGQVVRRRSVALCGIRDIAVEHHQVPTRRQWVDSCSIRITAEHNIHFGGYLDDRRRLWLAGTLRRYCLPNARRAADEE